MSFTRLSRPSGKRLEKHAYTKFDGGWQFEELNHILALFSEEEHGTTFAKTQTSSADLAHMQQIQNSLEIEVNSDGIMRNMKGISA